MSMLVLSYWCGCVVNDVHLIRDLLLNASVIYIHGYTSNLTDGYN